jgi:hypothetical protein
MSPVVEARILELRRLNPAWGPRTLVSRLARVSTAIRNAPLAVMRIPQGRPREFPADGHGFSPVLW